MPHASPHRLRALSLLTGVIGLALASCTTPRPANFSHEFHRVEYRLTDSELKGLQFFISTEVLAQTESPTERNTPTGNSVILLKRGTPGVVTEIGPNWLRVSFREGSRGVQFLAETDEYPLYGLATAGEDGTGLRLVKDVPGHLVVHEGVRYEVVKGHDAVLACDYEQLRELIDKRGIGPGREPDR
jgi:hypothetical protein